MSENSEENDGTITFHTAEFTQFLDKLKESVVETNADAMKFVFEQVFPPIMGRMDQIATAQVILAKALQSNRRDANAREFAKMFIQHALGQEEDALSPAQIAAQAYALANEMEVHAKVADLQSDAKTEDVEKHVASAPKHVDSAALVESYFGRAAKPTGKKPNPH